jgi:hypothetical protein
MRAVGTLFVAVLFAAVFAGVLVGLGGCVHVEHHASVTGFKEGQRNHETQQTSSITLPAADRGHREALPVRSGGSASGGHVSASHIGAYSDDAADGAGHASVCGEDSSLLCSEPDYLE